MAGIDTSSLSQDRTMPIAVVGMGFRGPADATDVQKLWKMILEGREGWSPIPKTRWNNAAFYHPDNARHGTINVEGGHFMTEDPSLFDAPFFNMTADEAAAMDPQQRLLLEVAYEAFENAGIPLNRVMGTKTACFVGSFCADYTDLLLRDPDAVPMYQCTNAGQSRAMTANRVSYFFDLKGPSVTVDTACSGGLVALHLACQSLRMGDASMAVAAGVNVVLSHEFMSTMCMMKFLSPDGRCYTFDENANGYARGEAIASLVLKPLADAIRDGDTIRAVIRASGSNQDGRTPGITLPSGPLQETLIRDVYTAAGLDPHETEFVETHGTGTQAGDPTEAGAVAKVFSPDRPPDRPLRLGSIKTNVGHLEGASGIAGVIKAVLMLENSTFLPNRNFKTLNSRIPLLEWKLKVQLGPEPWEKPRPHRVSVNSFGYGGSNAHIVLEDISGYLSAHGIVQEGNSTSPFGCATILPTNTNGLQVSSRGPNGINHDHPRQHFQSRLYVVSGFDEDACSSQVQRLHAYLEEKGPMADDEFMGNLALTLNERRTRFPWKTAVTGGTPNKVAEALSVVMKPRRAVKRPSIGFVFTGQGAQWCGMGKELLSSYPIFKRCVERIDAYLMGIEAPFTIEGEVMNGRDSARLSHPLLSQPICTALQIALVDLLASWGIFPDSVTGHSSGEIAAAYAVGVLSTEDAMAIAYHRGDAASKVAMSAQVKGAMLAVGMSVDEAESYLKTLKWGKVIVACKNSPSSLTISGDLAAIEELDQILREKQVFSRRLAVDVAYHSHHMELIREEYLDSIAHIKTRAEEDPAFQSSISFFSSVKGTEIPVSELGPRYWVENLLSQVKFAEALQRLCFETNSQRHAAGASSDKRQKRAGAAKKVSVNHLVEIGPHSALSGPIKQTLKANEKLNAADIIYSSVLTRKIDAITSALALAATLATSGCSLAFDAINRANSQVHRHKLRSLIDLPPYAWNHSKSYWAEPRLSKVYRSRKFPRTDLLGVPDNMSCPFEPRWRNFIRVSEIPWLSDHKIQSNIVYPAAGYIVMAIEACSQHASEHSDINITGYRLRDVSIQSALVINETSAVEVMVSLRPSNSNQPGSSSEWCEFRIYSVTIDNRWTEHCKGLVCVESGNEATCSIDEVRENLTSHTTITGDLSILDVEQFYEKVANAGLEYGSSFTNMINAHFTDDACFAEITVPNTAAVMPMNFQHPFVVHPCLLDSTFHSIFVPLIASMKGTQEPPVPVFVSQMYVGKDITSSPGDVLEVQTFLDNGEETDIVASITGRARDSRSETPALSITGLRCKRLAQDTTRNTAKDVDRIAYKLKWGADPDLLTGTNITRLIGDGLVNGPSAGNEPKLYEECAAHFIQKSLDSLNDVDVTTIKPHLKQLWSLITEVNRGKKSPDGGFNPKRAEAAGTKGRLLCAVGGSLDSIIRDEVDVGAMLNDHGLNVYWDNATHLVEGYRTVSRYLDMVGHKNPKASILEVGAGTGGASMAFMQQLTQESSETPRFGEYTCTNPDASTFEASAEKLSKWRQWINFKTLEIDGNLENQGLGSHAYDVVIVPHGLYTATSRSRVLRSIRALLRPDGHLIVIDPNSKRASLADNVIFGALPGWWADNPDISSNDGISEREWHHVLLQTQFSGVGAFLECSSNEGTCSVIVARPVREVHPSSRDAVIIAEDSNCGISLSYLQSHLTGLSFNVEVSDISHANPTDRFCIVLSEMNTPVFPRADEVMLERLKTIFLHSTGVVWVTRGGRMKSTNPDAGLVMGFARTARSESGVSPILTLDFDGQRPVSGQLAAEALCDLIRHRFVDVDRNNADGDVEYVEHDGALLIPRVVENGLLNRQIASSDDNQALSEQNFYQKGRPLRAVLNHGEDPESVHFDDDHKIPRLANDLIGIEVQANCLNTQGLKPASKLSSGCSGIVYAVGGAVRDFAPGDRVATLGSGSITSIYHDRRTAFQKIPENIPFEMAASLPAVYCTAYYVVNHIARVDSQDKVLIFGAEEGSGQAMLELCIRKQARIFATVRAVSQKASITSRFHIPEDQLFIDGDDFAESLNKMNIQGGFGVVINCRASEGKNGRIIGRWITPYSRYIHLGKGIPENFYPERAILFTDFDFDDLRKQQPTVVNNVWSDVMSLFSKGALQGPSSLTTYSISNLTQALRSFPEAGGKPVVVAAGPDDIVKATLPKKSNELLRADASYMLVGGLGGIGRATALWMAEHGARNLTFVNRSGLSNEAAQVTVQALKEKGVNVTVHACNVSDEAQFQRLTAELEETAPSIRGVIQAAMVLRDIHIEQMTVQDYHAVLQPKYAATWNLHRHLPSDMDFFLMLSSISGVIGNATQSAYAAGSTFMDSFAAYRSSLGFPAVSLDLGVITDVGYLAENKELAARMAQQGFQGTDTATLMSLIETAIVEPRRDADGVSSQIITGLGEWKEGQSLSNFDAALFAQFRRQYLRNGTDGQGENADETLREELALAKNMDDAAAIICSALGRKISAHLSVPVDSIEPSNPISEYGIDSHVAVELRNWVSKKLESTVPILDILASGSLLELSSKIATKSRLVHVGED